MGMSLIAVAIASFPYSKSVVGDAHAASGVQRVEICGYTENARTTFQTKKTKTVRFSIASPIISQVGYFTAL
jgi:hypothetical protein